jgi:hypothetical protein
MKEKILKSIFNILLFALTFILFGWLFALGGTPEDIPVLTAIGNATGVIMYAVIDQCER